MKLPKLSINLYIIAALIIGLLVREGCYCINVRNLNGQLEECRSESLVVNPVQVVAIDTVFDQHIDTIYQKVPVPYQVIQHKVDSFIAFEPLPFDTAAVLQKYFTENFFRDSVATKWGPVLIYDTLFRNQLVGRSVIPKFNVPVVTKTELQRIVEPKHWHLYAGFNVHASSGYFYTGPGLLLQTKRDQIFEAGVGLNSRGNVGYLVGLKWKVSK